MFVRNESGTVVTWPESEPLRPGCVVVDGNTAAIAVVAVDVIAPVDGSVSQVDTSAEAAATFATAAASVGAVAIDLAPPQSSAKPAGAALSSKK